MAKIVFVARRELLIYREFPGVCWPFDQQTLSFKHEDRELAFEPGAEKRDGFGIRLTFSSENERSLLLQCLDLAADTGREIHISADGHWGQNDFNQLPSFEIETWSFELRPAGSRASFPGDIARAA